jgi:hypothetical protein
MIRFNIDRQDGHPANWAPGRRLFTRRARRCLRRLNGILLRCLGIWTPENTTRLALRKPFDITLRGDIISNDTDLLIWPIFCVRRFARLANGGLALSFAGDQLRWYLTFYKPGEVRVVPKEAD